MAVTTQVGWTLLAGGVRVTPATLRDVTDHVLLGLPTDVSAAQAADAAVLQTRIFLAAARGERIEASGLDLPLSARWRRELDGDGDPVRAHVLREHYGNGQQLEDLNGDLTLLSRARDELKARLAAILGEDGVPADLWRGARLDALLCRLALYSVERCPPVAEVLRGEHRDHRAHCAVCERATRLVNAGSLDPAVLLQLDTPAWPAQHATALVLHFHPDARNARASLAAEFDVVCRPLEGDLLLVSLEDASHVHQVLEIAAEAGLPARQHLRGVVVTGPGRWSTRGLLGPLVASARRSVRSASWGHVEGIGELPGVLPPPPSSRSWWYGVAGLAAVAVLVLLAVGRPPAPASTLHTEFVSGRGGVWTQFDVPEHHLVTLVRAHRGTLEVVHRSTHPRDKVVLATGDGRYRLHTVGEGVLVAGSAEPLPDLDVLIAAAGGASDPIADLADRIGRVATRAQIATYTRPLYETGVGNP